MNSSPKTLTFGCRLNSFESEIMTDLAKKADLGDVLIVNSCAVTGEAVRQVRQAIRKARREEPTRKIIVTGCAAQTEGRMFGDMEEVDLVIGNDDKLRSDTYQAMSFDGILNDKVQVNDIMNVRETAPHMIEGMDGRTRAFVQVQNGCDHRCTFCIIPFGRGPSRSVPMGKVVEQIKKLVNNGYLEVVLTGVDTTSYGADLPGKQSLGKLVQQILHHVPDLLRLRISSIDSIEADEALFEAMAEIRFMPHLHLSLQSGDDMILKRMKRRHLRDDSLEFVEKARSIRPDMVFGADIIAGFPTETEEMFENSLSMISEANLIYTHIFPYSKREGTPAAKIPNQVEKSVAKRRAAMLRAAGERQFAAHCDTLVGSTAQVLIEKPGRGRTEQFVPVNIEGAVAGEIVSVKILQTSDIGLVGELVRNAA
ncbi:MAG: tRNA (N(6)-L-threonylcarbamoyladenosine(37)-C(2))-methylthiotransferase MtaB [Devosiaceae bacterium]|nr:tRNA (N(6)-L-threonylcarbamoyladenosine(37)-C(2))-methylthiotransferase MtaB [Devosiaceae bacterium]